MSVEAPESSESPTVPIPAPVSADRPGSPDLGALHWGRSVVIDKFPTRTNCAIHIGDGVVILNWQRSIDASFPRFFRVFNIATQTKGKLLATGYEDEGFNVQELRMAPFDRNHCVVVDRKLTDALLVRTITLDANHMLSASSATVLSKPVSYQSDVYRIANGVYVTAGCGKESQGAPLAVISFRVDPDRTITPLDTRRLSLMSEGMSLLASASTNQVGIAHPIGVDVCSVSALGRFDPKTQLHTRQLQIGTWYYGFGVDLNNGLVVQMHALSSSNNILVINFGAPDLPAKVLSLVSLRRPTKHWFRARFHNGFMLVPDHQRLDIVDARNANPSKWTRSKSYPIPDLADSGFPCVADDHITLTYQATGKGFFCIRTTQYRHT